MDRISIHDTILTTKTSESYIYALIRKGKLKKAGKGFITVDSLNEYMSKKNGNSNPIGINSKLDAIMKTQLDIINYLNSLKKMWS